MGDHTPEASLSQGQLPAAVPAEPCECGRAAHLDTQTRRGAEACQVLPAEPARGLTLGKSTAPGDSEVTLS